MPNLYARQTALTNVGGRIDYISNPERQENLLAVFDGAADLVAGTYWKQLAQECEAASKHATPGHKSVQGRELVIQLSNALLQKMSPEQIAEKLSRSFEEKYHRPCIVAVHFNKTKTNLHAHLIYAERDLLKEPEEKIAPRALFFDEEGKRHYKKAEILDENGDLRPGCRIVAKGEIYERRCFSAVDQKFSSREWLRMAKKEWLLPLRNGELKGDIEITEYDPNSGKLPQQHVGKVKDVNSPSALETVARIREYNQDVKEFNRMVDEGQIFQKVAVDIAQKSRRLPQKNYALRRFLQEMREMQRKIQAARQLKKQEEARRAKEEYEKLMAKNGKKGSLDNKINAANSRMNWKAQGMIDQALGTNYAKEDKKKYFAGKKNHSHDER